MVEIIISNKKIRVIILFSVIVLLIGLVLGDYANAVIDNSPAYVVVNRWYDNKEKRINLYNYSVSEDITLHTTITASQFVKPKLVIRARNMKIMARTNGRIILNTNDGAIMSLFPQYYIVDADDLDDGVVYLHLSPNKIGKGKIINTVYLTTENDFMYNRRVERSPLRIMLLLAIHSLILLFVYCLKNKYFYF